MKLQKNIWYGESFFSFANVCYTMKIPPEFLLFQLDILSLFALSVKSYTQKPGGDMQALQFGKILICTDGIFVV